jgi:hypothetical protein
MSEISEKTKFRKYNVSFKNFLLGISALLVIYLLISGWQISKVNLGFFELVSPKTITDNSTDINSNPEALRPLGPLETSQIIAFLPENIYGYAYAFEIADYQNTMDLSNVCDGYQFEIQKYSGNIYLIGYVTETDLNTITAIKSGTMVTIYPYNVKKDKKIIALNLKDILEISDKDIDIDETTRISTLELTTISNQIPLKVVEHRAQSCL